MGHSFSSGNNQNPHVKAHARAYIQRLTTQRIMYYSNVRYVFSVWVCIHTCVRVCVCVNLYMYVYAYMNCVQDIYIYIYIYIYMGHAVVQLVEAVCSNPEGRGFIGSFH